MKILSEYVLFAYRWKINQNLNIKVMNYFISQTKKNINDQILFGSTWENIANTMDNIYWKIKENSFIFSVICFLIFKYFCIKYPYTFVCFLFFFIYIFFK